MSVELLTDTIIKLPADPSKELDWCVEIELAKEVVKLGQKIVWEFDFGAVPFQISDKAYFTSLTVALDHFSQTIWKEFGEHSQAAIFYRNNGVFFSRIHWDQELVDNFLLWKEDLAAIDSMHTREVYSATVLAEYLHRLLACLPDSLQVFCVINYPEAKSVTQFLQIISKERFPHFQLLIPNAPWIDNSETKWGVCLPSDEALFQIGYEKLDQIFAFFITHNIPYRVLCESMLTEEWADLEGIVVVQEGVTSFGKRKLQGFCAAAGLVITDGEKFNFANEISFAEFKLKNN